VGQVICVIENPNRDLLPGTNVTAEIRAESVQNALTIPREAIRRELDFPACSCSRRSRDVKDHDGIGNTTRAQVEGLNERERRMPTEKASLKRDDCEAGVLFAVGGHPAVPPSSRLWAAV
jgi:hypothetical protein